MRALLDTNIIIHREAPKGINQDIGMLFKWLDKAGYTKCVHPATIEEIRKHRDPVTVDVFNIKLDSYEQMQTVATMAPEVEVVGRKYDQTDNDRVDTILVNELFRGRVDILVSEDKKIHLKVAALQIADRAYTIDTFLEKVAAEYPALVNYKVLSVRQELFGKIDLADPFFDSFKEDYPGFERWFNKKADEKAYITINNENGRLLSFLYLKPEGTNEAYGDIDPAFRPKKRMKIGTFKVLSNGFRLGERFLKIVFDNALANQVEEIYVTIFDKRDEQKRLITLLESWGFGLWGRKSNGEIVYTRDFSRRFNEENPRLTYPYISKALRVFLVPIHPEYHTELFPDSILRTESPMNFVENETHRNGINKVYVSRSIERDIRRGDILVFYRTGGYHKSVISTICLVEETVFRFKDEDDFVQACRKRSVFPEEELRAQWRHRPGNRPFVISMLYIYSFPKRANLGTLIENHIISAVNDAPRGFRQLNPQQFETILKITETNESFIID
jgi:hypothetical protein